jgi:hypothetical protein
MNDREPLDDADPASAAPPPTAPPADGPAPGDWPRDADPLDDGWSDWDDAPARARPAARVDWSALEVESFDCLPRGRVRVGRREHVVVDALPGGPVAAVMDTAAAGSCLRVTTIAGGDALTLRIPAAGLPDREVVVAARRHGDAWVLDATVHLGPHRQKVALRLVPAVGPDAPPLVLGVDALAGLVVVDPAEVGLLGGAP